MKFLKPFVFVSFISCLIIWARWIPHESNFSPVIALFLLSGFLGRGRWFSFVLPASALLLTDLYLGLYSNLALTYVPLLLLVALGTVVQGQWARVYGMGLLGATSFFLISNFGVWWWSQPALYPYTLSGLIDCYGMALPFFRASLLSTLMTLATAHALYELCKRWSLLPSAMATKK